MLNKGEEMFMFESEFFKVSKKYLEMGNAEMVERLPEMMQELDVVMRTYKGINEFYDEYVMSRGEWLYKILHKKEQLGK